MSKGIMFCGGDKNKYARAVAVNEDGVLLSEFDYELDDNNKKVLRVVDAAPFLVEYGVITELNTETKTVANGYTKVLEENSDRKFASIFNNSESAITITPSTSGVGIVVLQGERYEMSALKGNLYQGQMYASLLMQEHEEVSSFQQGGIQSDGTFSSSAKRTHTDYIPVNVSAGGTNFIVSVNSGASADIRNVCCYDENNSATYYNPEDQTKKFPVEDGAYTQKEFTINNQNVKYIAVSFAKKDAPNDNYSTSDMTGVVLSVFKNTDHELIVTEGE